MASVLVISTCGSEDPTRAALALAAVMGSVQAGHEVSLALVGDAAVMMREVVRQHTVPVGLPSYTELFQFAVDHKVPVYV